MKIYNTNLAEILLWSAEKHREEKDKPNPRKAQQLVDCHDEL